MLEEVVSIFLSYSRKDGDILSRLHTHLAGLIRTQKIKTWHDRDIEAGSEWAPAIQHQLNTADIIILLISADFIASEYCYGNELQRAIARHHAGEAIVIPIILKPCLWNLREIPFSKLNVLPDHARPISKWADPEEALATITQHISIIVERLKTQKAEQRRAEEREVQARWESRILDQAKAARDKEQRDQQNEAALRQRGNVEAERIIPALTPISSPALVPSPKPIPPTPPRYTQLEKYLRTQNWRKADEETYMLMLTTVGKIQGDWFIGKDLENFPCEDLQTIDQLWVKYSNGKWGFSIQNQIWEKCSSPTDTINKKWIQFGDRIGWYKVGQWVDYNQLSFDLTRQSPKGEFPAVAVGWFWGFGRSSILFTALAQRLVDCSIS